MGERIPEFNIQGYEKIQGGKRSSCELVCIAFVFIYYGIVVISTTEIMFSGDVYISVLWKFISAIEY